MTIIAQHVLEQRTAALDRANSIRTGVSEVRARIKALPKPDGRLAVADLLECPSDVVLSMKVWDLLVLPRKLGHIKAGRWLGRVCPGMRPDKRVRELTVRQRLELAQILRGQQ